MKQNGVLLPIGTYVIATLFSQILWIFFPPICHFMGASSLHYAFLFATGVDNILMAILILAWIPLFIVNLIAWFIYALKKGVYLPFLIVVGLDLVVSLLIICSKIYSGNNTDLLITIIGYVVRLAFYFWMIDCTRKVEK